MYYNLKTEESLICFKCQRNYCNRLYRRERKKFYSKLNVTNFFDNKKFWKNIKPFLSDKGISNTNITLIEDNRIISNDLEVTNTLSIYFENVVSLLEIPQICDYIVNNEGISDPINAIIMKYSKHPSIIKINECIEMSGFMFKCCNISEIQNEISNLKNNTAAPSGSVSAPLLKEYKDICGEFLLNIINYGITNSIYDNGMKRADITPFPNEEKSNDKKNFRPISVLPAGSKIFERILHKQISSHIENYLSSYLCGYRKGYCAQYAILTLLEKWRISLHNKGYGGAILLDLSKAFDTINHDLLIAKLNAYGFSHSLQNLLYSYLSNRWQQTKINYTFSLWTEILQGVPQGSILGPLCSIYT